MAEMLEGDPFFNSRNFTAAEPGFGTFAQKLADLGKEARGGVSDAVSMLGAPGAAIAGALGATPESRNLIGAAFEANRLNDQFVSSNRAFERAADMRIDIIREQTGMTLENPFRQGYYMEARKRVEDERAAGGDVRLSAESVLRKARDIFNENINLAAERFPDKAAAFTFGQPIEDQARAIGRAAADAQTVAAGNVKDDAVRLGATLAGGFAGSLTDPVQVAGLFLGAGEVKAVSTAARLSQVALREAAINAGLQAAEEPFVQAWRKQLGLESGLVPALENIAMAGGLAGLIGGGVQGVREVVQVGRRADIAAIERVANGEGTLADMDRAAKALGLEIQPETRAAIKAAEAIEADVSATAPKSKADPEANAEASAAAARNAENPETSPPAIAPIEPVDISKKPLAVPDLRDEAPALGAFRMMDKPVSEIRVSPARLETDARTFQYKENADGSGVTERLQGVQAIAPLSTGKLVVFERADGVQVVADGHQRAGLFKRLTGEDGRVPVEIAPGVIDRAQVDVPAFLFREADGWTPADVRAIAAIKNIQEGSGSLMDTARVLRDRPELFGPTLNVARGQVQQAAGLAALAEDAWGMAINGVVQPHYAALVGRIVPERPEVHAALMRDLAQQRPDNITDAQFIIRDALAGGFQREVQETMFGQLEASRSLLAERRQVYGAMVKKLKADKGLFALLTREAEGIEAAGNKLDKGRNAATAGALDELLSLIEIVATRAGPVSDMLTARAAMVADGVPVARASADLAADIVERLRSEGRGFLLQEPKLAPERAPEPGSRESVDLVETYSAADLEAAGQGNMFGEAPAPPPALARADIEAKPVAERITAVDDAGARFDFAADLAASCKP